MLEREPQPDPIQPETTDLDHGESLSAGVEKTLPAADRLKAGSGPLLQEPAEYAEERPIHKKTTEPMSLLERRDEEMLYLWLGLNGRRFTFAELAPRFGLSKPALARHVKRSVTRLALAYRAGYLRYHPEGPVQSENETD